MQVGETIFSTKALVLAGIVFFGGALPSAPAQDEAPAALQEEVAEEEMPPLIPEPRSVPGIPDELVAKVDVFFALLSRGRVDGAYDSLVRGTVIESKPADVETLKKKTREALELFGRLGGHDIASHKRVGERLIRITSISFGENYPLRWRFYFYKSRGEWGLIDIRVDDRLSDLFGEHEAPANPSR